MTYEPDDVSEFLRSLGKNFAAWRRFHLLSNDELHELIHQATGVKFDNSLISKFETGKLVEFIERAMDVMAIDIKELVVGPPAPEEHLIQDPNMVKPKEPIKRVYKGETEKEIDAEVWEPHDPFSTEIKQRMRGKIDAFADKRSLSATQADYLMDMLTGAPRAEQHRYAHIGKMFSKTGHQRCCDNKDPYVMDVFVYNGKKRVVQRCNNCGMDWVEDNGNLQP